MPVDPPARRRQVPEILRANILTRFNFILGVLLAVILAVGAPQDALFGIVLVANALIGITLLVAAAGAAALTAFWLTFRKRGQSQARPGEE